MAHALDTTFYRYIYSDVPRNSFLARKHYIYIGSKQQRFSSKFNFYVINPLFKWENDELKEIKEFIRTNNLKQNIPINIAPRTVNKIPAPQPVQVLNYFTPKTTTSEINTSEVSNLLTIINELKQKVDLLESNIDNKIDNKINEIKFNVDDKFNTNLNSIYDYLKMQIEYTNYNTENSVKDVDNKIVSLEKSMEYMTNNLFSQITNLNSIISNISKENFPEKRSE